MQRPDRPIAFVLASSNHGTMIVNRNDYRMVDASHGFGVGFQILNKSGFDEDEVSLALAILNARRKHFGDGVHTVEWARHMNGWGSVVAFEAQEYVYYALAGNIAINNCMNARAYLAALGEKMGELSVPMANPFVPASYGSLELRKRANTEFIGQDVSYAPEQMTSVPMMTIDALGLQRFDFFKLDVEGMEADVLRGAMESIKRHLPVLLVEVIKSDKAALETIAIGLGYQVFQLGMNMLAIHKSDPTLQAAKLEGSNFRFTA